MHEKWKLFDCVIQQKTETLGSYNNYAANNIIIFELQRNCAGLFECMHSSEVYNTTDNEAVCNFVKCGLELTHQSLLIFLVTTILSPSLNPNSSFLSGWQSYRATTTSDENCGSNRHVSFRVIYCTTFAKIIFRSSCWFTVKKQCLRKGGCSPSFSQWSTREPMLETGKNNYYSFFPFLTNIRARVWGCGVVLSDLRTVVPLLLLLLLLRVGKHGHSLLLVPLRRNWSGIPLPAVQW